MNRFISYIEDTLHMTANVSVYGLTNTLPPYLRNGYELYTLTVQSVPCLLARPVEQTNLTDLRKQAGTPAQ